MNSQTLREARQYEEICDKRIPSADRPAFHLSPRVGWMNDPNGFCIYQGMYHMFYQYHPYHAIWGSMYWGHAVSRDLLHWEYLPTALAPDEFYDKDGCFSGSSVVLPDGRHMLIYTGVMNKGNEYVGRQDYQQQCIAIGDGINYEKYHKNPVISTEMIPEGASTVDFRDPKIWRREDGTYRCLVGSRAADNSGQLLLYRSQDGISWEFHKIFAVNGNRYGRMWECPDFFELDGKGVILVSPQEMLPEGFEYHNGNGTVCFIGDYDAETETFYEERNHAIDYGIDFYAPQTLKTADGRQIMIGWMQNWDTSHGHDRMDPWFGQMTLPRELFIRDGRLCQRPIRELETLHGEKTEYHNLVIAGDGKLHAVEDGDEICEHAVSFPGLSGRRIDMEVHVRPANPQKMYEKFTLSVAADHKYHTDINFRPKESMVKIDRKFSGSRQALIHQRRAKIDHENGELTMRIIMDRFSVEVFLQDGAKTMTATVFTGQDADQIYFHADEDVLVDVVKYDLK